ncbi:O-antigen ligase family protein [Halocatena halophila]|uniref:O-antigen ligase family protein n=1 Tax=Halocatena halophila TaxID=2814576 RepID=UPI002ED42237
MRRLDWLFVCIIVFSSLSYASNLGSLLTVFRVLILSTYGIIFFLYIYYKDSVFKQQRFVFYTLGGVWFLYMLHLLIPPTSPELFVRVLIFVVVSAINILLIPRVIQPSVFFRTVSRLGALVVVVGLPAVFIGPYTVGPLHIQAANGSFGLFPVGFDISAHPLMSYYRNQNFASVTILAGLLGALHEFDQEQYRLGSILFAINGIGLWLCHARSTLLAGAIGVGIYAIYRLKGPQIVQVGIIAGFPFAIGGFLMAFFKFGPQPISTINLTGRRQIWMAAGEAILDRPLIGWGPIALQPVIEQYISGFKVKPPHNSFLLMTMRTGIIGGIAYAGFIGLSLLSNLRSLSISGSIVGLSMAISLTVVMLFQNFVLFGLNASNIIASVAIGYAAYDVISLEEPQTV